MAHETVAGGGTLKLREGGLYATRGGTELQRPLVRNTGFNRYQYPWAVGIDTYTDDGRFFSDQEGGKPRDALLDLVRELNPIEVAAAPEPKLQVREGAYYQRRDGSRTRNPAVRNTKKRSAEDFPWRVDGEIYTDDGHYWIDRGDDDRDLRLEVAASEGEQAKPMADVRFFRTQADGKRRARIWVMLDENTGRYLNVNRNLIMHSVVTVSELTEHPTETPEITRWQALAEVKGWPEAIAEIERIAPEPIVPPTLESDIMSLDKGLAGIPNCTDCGQKTMHMGDTCYSCSQSPKVVVGPDHERVYPKCVNDLHMMADEFLTDPARGWDDVHWEPVSGTGWHDSAPWDTIVFRRPKPKPEPAVDLGPQRGPSSVAKVEAESKAVKKRLAELATQPAPTFPNPLCIAFGQGRVAVSNFTASGGAGIMFRDTGEPHRVGETDNDSGEDDHIPQPGEVYLHFANVESAMVVREALDKAIAELGADQSAEQPDR